MRIAVLSNHWIHVDRRIVSQLNWLIKKGHVVTFISVPAEYPADLDRSVESIGLFIPGKTGTPGRMQLLLRRFRRLIVGACQGPVHYTLFETAYWLGNLHHNLAESGTPYFVSKTPTSDWEAIVCHDLATLHAGTVLKMRLNAKPRLIYDAHELYPYQFYIRPLQRLWERAERRFRPVVDSCFTVNPSIAAVMKKTFGYPEVRVVYNSVDIRPENVHAFSHAEFLRAFQAPESIKQKVIFQGSIGGGRGIKKLLQAMSELPEDVGLFLVGTAAENYLSRLARKVGLKRLYFKSRCESVELLCLLASADLGVIPYDGGDLLNNQLCTPNKLFEFIVCGIPIVASDLPELRRIVGGGAIGVVENFTSPGRLADAISRGLRMKSTESFRKAISRAQYEFSWERQTQELEQVFTFPPDTAEKANSSHA